MKRRHDTAEDLFSMSAGAFAAAPASAAATAGVAAERLIDSPLVDDTRPWLEGQAKVLGAVLAADRAVEYVAILRALAEFRRHHEPEPLHEDVSRRVCGEAGGPAAEQSFKNAIRQLKEWGLVTERIEKERLRGYRDSRRTKFRYRMSDEAAAFVDWLAERRSVLADDAGGDVSGNLLDLQCSLLHELRRKLRDAAKTVDPDAAGDVLFRVRQMHVYVDQTARSLQELNLRLLAFGAESFAVSEAKPVIDELSHFLERFGRRFGVLREEIVQDLAELRRPSMDARWNACAEVLRAEAARLRHIASVRIPDVAALLADAAAFYAPDGALVDLMRRIVDSARKVWGKLNARLRELERRNHRLEDVGARLVELAALPEGVVPSEWMRRLLETAAMRGDAHVRPGGEKAHHPLPRTAAKVRTKTCVTWITPREVGRDANVASIAQRRGERLKDWMRERGILPACGAETRISALHPQSFDDFPNVVRLIEHLRLGGGEKGRRYLGVVGTDAAAAATVAADGFALTFDDLALSEARGGDGHED